MKKFVLFFIFIYNVLSASEKVFIELHCRDKAGLFSVFHDVLALLKYYDKGLYNGIEINFEKEGLYYSYEYGDNWFNYYCEPICFGEKINVVKAYNSPDVLPSEICSLISRKEAFSYIDKYLKFKPCITQRVENFCNENLINEFVISVHYRGTDKFIAEANFVSYDTMTKRIQEVVSAYHLSKYKIFVATDENAFLKYLILKFGDSVCYTDSIRSLDGEPIHLGRNDPYQCGEDALVDAILLSKGHVLIRTSSNLSKWSTFFNPEMQVYELKN